MSNFKYPARMDKHIRLVMGGEYDIDAGEVTSVVDLGANVGSFAVWALNKWPGCRVYCFEPSKANFEMLADNTKEFPSGKVNIVNAAVGDPTLTRLYAGKNNPGECSLMRIGEQSDEFEDVNTVPPESIPSADVLKLDVEGSEGYILSELKKKGLLSYRAVLLEYHGEEVRRKIDDILSDYVLVGGQIYGPHRGVLKYLKK
jgi:FkbM family methyltransferase